MLLSTRIIFIMPLFSSSVIQFIMLQTCTLTTVTTLEYVGGLTSSFLGHVLLISMVQKIKQNHPLSQNLITTLLFYFGNLQLDAKSFFSVILICCVLFCPSQAQLKAVLIGMRRNAWRVHNQRLHCVLVKRIFY